MQSTNFKWTSRIRSSNFKHMHKYFDQKRIFDKHFGQNFQGLNTVSFPLHTKILQDVGRLLARQFEQCWETFKVNLPSKHLFWRCTGWFWYIELIRACWLTEGNVKLANDVLRLVQEHLCLRELLASSDPRSTLQTPIGPFSSFWSSTGPAKGCRQCRLQVSSTAKI